jgi:hypothetical protein
MRNLIFAAVAGVSVLGVGSDWSSFDYQRHLSLKIVVKTEKVTCPDAISLSAS